MTEPPKFDMAHFQAMADASNRERTGEPLPASPILGILAGRSLTEPECREAVERSKADGRVVSLDERRKQRGRNRAPR